MVENNFICAVPASSPFAKAIHKINTDQGMTRIVFVMLVATVKC